MRLDFPGELPDMKGSINGQRGIKLQERMRHIQQARERWYWLIREQIPPQDALRAPLRLVLEVRWPDNRTRDPDGVLQACKPLIDGLVAIGLLTDDSHKYVRELVVRSVPKGEPVGTAVTLEERCPTNR